MLEKISHIEGLGNLHDDIEMYDDIRPGDTIVKFLVVSEEYLQQDGSIDRKNFVYIYKEKDLGRTSSRRRIRDTVAWDESTQKWEIKRLYPGKCLDETPKSDIRRYTNEWNAFMRGAKEGEWGTPLGILFKNDPARVDFYKGHHIVSIEQLSNQSEGNCDLLGMGARSDRERAKKYIAKLKEMAPSVEIASKLEEKDRQISSLTDQIRILTDTMNKVLEGQQKESASYSQKRVSKQVETPSTL